MTYFRSFRITGAAALFALFLWAASGPVYAASTFINGFDDMPLMPGLVEPVGGLMTFDSPTGRIVENVATGNLKPQAVLEFYKMTLPQLGWKQSGPRVFVREDEILRLEFSTSNSVSTASTLLSVRFILRPVEK